MNLEKAKSAILFAWILGVVKGIGTLCLVVYSTCIEPVYGVGFEGLVDVAIALGLSFGIYRRSRACAVLMICYDLFCIVAGEVEKGNGAALNAGYLIALLYFFVQGARGTFAYHKLTRQQAAAPPDNSPPVIEAISPATPNVTMPRSETTPVHAYFILQDDEPEGPYSIEELRSLWNAGTITRETFYCEEGYDEWLRLEKMADHLQSAAAEQTSAAERQTNLSPGMTPPPLPSAAVSQMPAPLESTPPPLTQNPELTPPLAERTNAEGNLASPAARLGRPALRPGPLVAGTVAMLGAFGLVVWLANKDGEAKPVSGAAVANGLAETKARADKGDAQAQYRLGWRYYKGDGVAKDAAEAVKWWRKAAEQGQVDAQTDVGNCYHEGDGVAKDAVEAVKWLGKAAEQGQPDAQYKLGYCYDNGQGVAKDEVEAVKWYRKAAEQGSARGQFNLGDCYDNGQGVAKDEVEAVKWWRKAAEQGFASAQFNLGRHYADGDGVAKDAAEAVKWHRKAAEQGEASAQHELGLHYHNGEGVTKDAKEAVKWFRKAAEQDNVLGQFHLAGCYEDGDGVAKDAAEAVKWLGKAADQGQPDAQYRLGYCYANGDGVPKDYVEAYKWMNLASAQGNEGAKENLTILERRMTPSQIAEAQQLAREFKPRQFKPQQW